MRHHMVEFPNTVGHRNSLMFQFGQNEIDCLRDVITAKGITTIISSKVPNALKTTVHLPTLICVGKTRRLNLRYATIKVAQYLVKDYAEVAALRSRTYSTNICLEKSRFSKAWRSAKM